MASSSDSNNSVALTTSVEIDSVSNIQAMSEFMVMTSLKAPTYQSAKRAPLDLIAVVDRSGSMAGKKLELVKKTLHFVQSQLTPTDRLGIVAYDDRVTIPLSLTAMDSDGKNRATSAIDNIKSGGSTNICGGLIRAVEEMRTRTTKNEVASILLFTDGQANVGPTDDKGIIAAVTNPASTWYHEEMYNNPNIPNKHQYQNQNQNQYQQEQMQQIQYYDMNALLNNNTSNNSPSKSSNNRRQQQVQQMSPVQYPQISNQLQQQQQVQQMPNVVYNQISPSPYVQQVQQMPIMQQQVQQMPVIIPQQQQQQPMPIVTPSASSHDPIPCTINTFGYGSDHNPGVLKGIAEAASGIYYFIEGPDTIPEAFADCLGGLLSVAAQNITLKFEAVEPVKIKRVTVGKFKMNEIRAGKEYELNIGDIQSDEQRDIILHVDLPKLDQPQEQFPIVKVTLNYLNVITTSLEEVSTTAVVSRPSTAPSNTKVNYELDKQRNRLLAAEAMEKATLAGNSNNLDQARELLRTCISRIQESVSAEDTFCKGLIVDLKQCEDTLRDRQTFQQQGQHLMMNNSSAHYHQRSSNTRMASQAAYQTPSRAYQQVQQQQQFQ